MISEETIRTVRDNTNLVQVIGERVKLERAGRSFKGLCPFHKEKTPSFHVNPERNFYYCFGCQAKGDGIRFVQETEGLSFVEAVRELASRLGIEIEETRSLDERRQEQDQKRRLELLYAVSDAAAAYYERCLAEHPLRELADAELARRGLSFADAGHATALRAFRIGYAPHAWDGLAQALKAGGFSPVAAENVGLLVPRKSGPGHYDRFRHRLMFAITDLRGRVVGFSGRSLAAPSPEQMAQHGLSPLGSGDEAPAKYMNSPESAIYKKREIVFGLYQARDAVRQQNECVLVEGNFDVMSLHARGILNVVAPLGTAFTREQAAQVKRYTERVTLLFDGDAAGRKAAASAREPCQQEGLLARVASLPQGLDPDDLVQRKGPDALRACLQSARGMLEHLIETTLESGFSGADAETRGKKIQGVLDLIKNEQDPTVRALAASHADTIASRLGISDVRSLGALARAVRQAGVTPSQVAERAPNPDRARSPSRTDAIEAAVLGVLVEHPRLLAHPQVEPLLAHTSGALALSLSILARGPELAERLEQFPEQTRPVVAEHLVAPRFEEEVTALRVLLENLRKLGNREHKALKAELESELREAQRSGDRDREDELLGALHQLNRARMERAK